MIFRVVKWRALGDGNPEDDQSLIWLEIRVS
jgi:hypothetical protein